MKLQNYRCQACGYVAPLKEVLTVPDVEKGEQAKPLPCKCGKTDWILAR